MVVLDSSVRLIIMQFSFSSEKVVPSSIKFLERETLEEHIERKSRLTGLMGIKPTEKCSLLEFIQELELTGYELVDAFYKERIDDAEFGHNIKTYHTVRFIFARHEFAEVSDNFKKMRDNVRQELRNICQSAMWRVRAFLNPFYKNGEEVIGQCALSINLEARQPFFRPNGQPVTMWQKDEVGNRIGDAPFPIRADYSLHIVDNAVKIMAV